MEKAQVEQLLGKIHDLEAMHVQMKQEISKILLSNTPMDNSRLPAQEAACSVHGVGGAGGDGDGDFTGACSRIDYYASWKNLTTPMESSSSRIHESNRRNKTPINDFCSSGGDGGTRFQSPMVQLTARQYLNILQSMGQAIHTVDVNNRLIYWNRAAERLYGYTAVEALSSEVFELLVDKEYHALGNNIVSRVKKGETWSGLFPIRSKRGRRFSVIITDSPLYDGDGTLIGVSCVACDSRPFQNNRFTLPGKSSSEADVGFRQARSSITSKHGLLLEQPKKVAFSSKVIDLAAKVSNRVRSKMKTGKRVVEHEARSTHICDSDYGSSDAINYLNKDGLSSCKDGFRRNAAPSFDMLSQTDGSGSKSRKDWVERSEGTTAAYGVSSNVKDWIRKYAIKRPWKGNNQEFSAARSNKFDWPWLQGEHDHDHLSMPRRSEVKASEYAYPVVAEPYELLSSSFNFSSTSSSISSESECSSSVQKLEIASDLDYEVLQEDLIYKEQIGRGSCGTVYLGLWCGSDVAIKVFSRVDYSEETILSFRQEVSLMKALRHPNILLFMGAVTSPKQLCIVTEFLPRGSLFHLLHKRSDKLDWRRRSNMALDIAQGMNYLHHFTPPIIHRDLKSSNLLVDINWNVKVADFGLSRIKHETFLITKTGKGTPQWMAPEVCRYEPSDEKSDIYSFGVILWELATEKIPWEDLNAMQVIGAVGFRGERLEIPSNVDPGWAAVIESCWQSEPRSRPSFQDLIKRLKDLAREYTVKHRRRDGIHQIPRHEAIPA